jgi:hypothetical protein
MIGFEYSTTPHERRHGPGGYRDYDSYRDWLRDEFMFRCVYCLHREQWDRGGSMFHIDHFVPVAADPDGKLEYSNLLYACARCNEAKGSIHGVPDPCQIAFHDCLRIMEDGSIEALNNEGKKLKLVLRLDSEKSVRDRSRWVRNLEFLRINNAALYQEYMAFPIDLPDLRNKRVPENAKPEGALNCYFVHRERGVLPAIY